MLYILVYTLYTPTYKNLTSHHLTFNYFLVNQSMKISTSVHSLFGVLIFFLWVFSILIILLCFTGGVQNGTNSRRHSILSRPIRQQVLTSRNEFLIHVKFILSTYIYKYIIHYYFITGLILVPINLLISSLSEIYFSKISSYIHCWSVTFYFKNNSL